MVALYTIFEDGELMIDCTDDMNGTESWSMSGKVWTSREEAERCLENMSDPAYDFGKLEIIELKQD